MNTTRREFLKTSAVAAAAIGVPYYVPATALGFGRTAPSDRIVMGAIGTGGQGRGIMNRFMSFDDVQVVAVCDVEQRRLKAVKESVDQKYGNQDCKQYGDFRELVARDDIDMVTVTTPDHWHALCSVAAANSGKHIYCEKPLSNSIGEGRAIADAVKKNNVKLQTGSHERSGENARFAAELVRNGRIGKLHTIRINLPDDDGHHQKAKALKTVPPPQPIPEGFDYDFWLGHTPQVPYTEGRCHFMWRFILAYGGGEMTDRGAHVIDLAQLAAGFDDTGPIEIDATGAQTPGSLYDTFWEYRFTNRFANGVMMIGEAKGPRGLRLEGDDGWIFIHVHGQKLEASDPKLLENRETKNFKIQLGRSPGHQRDLIEAIKTGRDPVATAEIGHRTASVCHLNNIAMRLGRKLKWDPEKEQFQDDSEANSLITPIMRAPWKLS
ncbi:MAG: Gfo/Idh/MocA family oxidoreductase [Pirellulales bacterium]